MTTYIMQLLSKRPHLGLVSSLLTITLTHLQVLQIIGAVLAIVIGVVTAILKVIELREKLDSRKIQITTTVQQQTTVSQEVTKETSEK